MMNAAVFLMGIMTGIVSLMVITCLVMDKNSNMKCKKQHEQQQDSNKRIGYKH